MLCQAKGTTGKILPQLCERKEVTIIATEVRLDHMRFFTEILLKISALKVQTKGRHAEKAPVCLPFLYIGIRILRRLLTIQVQIGQELEWLDMLNFL